jgi:hypothetical protein
MLSPGVSIRATDGIGCRNAGEEQKGQVGEASRNQDTRQKAHCVGKAKRGALVGNGEPEGETARLC